MRKCTYSGAFDELLDSYWRDLTDPMIHTNGLYNLAGATSLVAAGRGIVAGGSAPYNPQEANLVYLGGATNYGRLQSNGELLSNFSYTMGQAYTKPLIPIPTMTCAAASARWSIPVAASWSTERGGNVVTITATTG